MKTVSHASLFLSFERFALQLIEMQLAVCRRHHDADLRKATTQLPRKQAKQRERDRNDVSSPQPEAPVVCRHQHRIKRPPREHQKQTGGRDGPKRRHRRRAGGAKDEEVVVERSKPVNPFPA